MIPHKKNKHVTRWFAQLAEKKLKTNFRKCSLTEESQIPLFEDGVPVVAVSNHSSWWDPMLCLYLSKNILKRDSYGVFDEAQLRRYGIFRLIGGYSVNRQSTDPKEIKQFLRYSKDLLSGSSRLLWIFPQGELLSNDQLPFSFKRGFASIVSQLPKFHLLKIITSYDFWIEPKPEIVVDLMPLETVVPEKGSRFSDEMTERVAGEMTDRMHEVKAIIRHRDHAKLKPLFVQEHGTNVVYDLYRKARSALVGESFRKSHGEN